MQILKQRKSLKWEKLEPWQFDIRWIEVMRCEIRQIFFEKRVTVMGIPGCWDEQAELHYSLKCFMIQQLYGATVLIKL